MSLIENVIKLKTFITNGLKYSSVAIVIIIPLAILLSYYGFVREEVVVLITEIVLYFAVAEALTNAILKKIKKEKVEFAEVKAQIQANNFEALDKYKKQDVQFSEATVESLITLITSFMSKKKVDAEITKQAEEVIINVAKDTSTVSEPEYIKEPIEFTR